jgi:hypothetical protein
MRHSMNSQHQRGFPVRNCANDLRHVRCIFIKGGLYLANFRGTDSWSWWVDLHTIMSVKSSCQPHFQLYSRERAGCEFAGETEVHESLCFHGGSWDPYRIGFGMTRPNIKRGFKRWCKITTPHPPTKWLVENKPSSPPPTNPKWRSA